MKRTFALTLLLARKWEVLVNREYPGKGELTVKQLLFLIVVGNSFDSDPAVSEVAAVMATSRQNVKAIAENLAGKGHLTLYTDPLDRRTVRMKLHRKRDEYWQKRNERDIQLLTDFFRGVSDEDLAVVSRTVEALDSQAKNLF